MTEKITIAHSPDADDAFTFYGISCGAIREDGIEPEQILKDIQGLNEDALSKKWDVSAVSFAVYARIVKDYILLPHGASFGDNYGPIVVSKSKIKTLEGLKIALPGKWTSAVLALGLYEKGFIPVYMPFDKITDAVKNDDVDCGLIIHEGQITYERDGLICFLDLGKRWMDDTGLPLPLGGNVIKRDMPQDTISKISRLLKNSIEYGLSHRKEALEYASSFGRGLPIKDIDNFVGMYVNDLTLAYGERGEKAVDIFLKRAFEKGLIPLKVEMEFAL